MRISDWSLDVCSSDLEFILREAIMHLYDVDGLRSDPRGVERSLRSSARHAEPSQLPHVTSFEGSCRVRRHRLGPNSTPTVQSVSPREFFARLHSRRGPPGRRACHSPGDPPPPPTEH